MKIKNLFFQWLLKLPWKRNDSKRERFLIVSTTGLGDTLWGTPAIRALRQAHPHAYIAALTSTLGEEVLKGNPNLDEIFVVKEPAFLSLLFLYWKLRKREITTAYILHTSQRPILPFCRMIGASSIIGTKDIHKGLDFILTKTFKQKPVHEIVRRFEIVGISADPSMEITLTPKEEEEAAKVLKEIPSYVSIVGLHPGAKDQFKQWPPELFTLLGRRLKDHFGCQIIVTGNSFEKELVEKIASQIEGAKSIAGDLSVRSLAALIRKMHLFISNDTGPMHLACAVKTPVVALFAPTDPRLCGPFHASKSAVVQKMRTCTPCLRKKCREPFCLLQISPEEVYQTALKVYYGT